MKIGFIGLGAMGMAMARNLHQTGLLVAAWNRTPDKAQSLASETGCLAAGSIKQLASNVDVCVLCVSADADVLEVVGELCRSLESGALVIDCSTVAAATARQAAEMLADQNIGFLDCPVSGGTEGAHNATLSIIVGGEIDNVTKAMPILNAMGKRIVHIGAVGSGQATKAVNQIAVAGINQAVSEALAFAAAEKLPLEKVIDALGGGAAGSWFLANRGPNMIRNEYPLGFRVTLHSKDLNICRDMAAEHGVQLPIVEMTLIHYQRLVEKGFGDEDISSLFRVKQELFSSSST